MLRIFEVCFLLVQIKFLLILLHWKIHYLIRQGANNFGTQCIVVAIDAKLTKKSRIKSGYEVFSHGGTRPTNIDAIEWAKKAVKLWGRRIIGNFNG